MPVQMQRMRIVGSIPEDETVAGALLEREFLVVWIYLSVDREGVELAHAARHFLEHHVDGLKRRIGGLSAWPAEHGVIPGRLGRCDPLRLSSLVRVFDDHAQPA